MATKYEREINRIKASDTGGSESDHGQLAQAEPPWWKDLTVEQREIHYNRHRPCEHEYTFIPHLQYGEEFREQRSFDPYFNMPHLFPHSVEKFFLGTCECQTCVLKFGIERESERRPVNETELRERLRGRQQHVECVCDPCWEKNQAKK